MENCRLKRAEWRRCSASFAWVSPADVSPGVIVIENPGRDSCDGGVLRYVFGDHRPGADRRVASDLYIFHDTDMRGDIDIVPYDCRRAVIGPYVKSCDMFTLLPMTVPSLMMMQMP